MCPYNRPGRAGRGTRAAFSHEPSAEDGAMNRTEEEYPISSKERPGRKLEKKARNTNVDPEPDVHRDRDAKRKSETNQNVRMVKFQDEEDTGGPPVVLGIGGLPAACFRKAEGGGFGHTDHFCCHTDDSYSARVQR